MSSNEITTIVVGLQGPPGPAGANGTPGGPPGPAGANGIDGRTILNGNGAPSAGLGATGDYYIDNVALTIYGPKLAGAWGTARSLRGPAGVDGAPGAQGIQGPAGPAGTTDYNQLANRPTIPSAHSQLTGVGTNTHAQLDAHVASTSNPHGVTAAQVGNAIAQWNASQLQGRAVATVAPVDDDSLSWDAVSNLFTPRQRMPMPDNVAEEIAKLFKGQAGLQWVSIGDSRTEGVGSSPWSSSTTDGSNVGVGSGINEVPTPTNTFQNVGGARSPSTVARNLLRTITGNTSFEWFNRGYGGQEIYTSWPITNYDALMTGITPSLVFIDFGTNDVNQGLSFVYQGKPATQLVYEKHIELVRLARRRGHIPVILATRETPDSVQNATPSTAGYENTFIAHVNAIKRRAALAANCLYLDVNDLFRQFISASGNPAWNWRSLFNVESTVLVHENDTGYALAALCLLYTLLGEDFFYRLKPGTTERIIFTGPRANYPLDENVFAGQPGAATFTVTDLPVNNHALITGGEYTAGQALINAWVWVETPRAQLLYQSVGHGGAPSGTTAANCPQIVVRHATNMVTPVFTGQIPGSGVTPLVTDDYRLNEIVTLPMGLNNIQLVAGQDTTLSLKLGHFVLVPSSVAGGWDNPGPVVQHASDNPPTTRQRWKYPVPGSGPWRVDAPSTSSLFALCQPMRPDGSNLISFGLPGDEWVVLTHFEASPRAALMLVGGPSRRTGGVQSGINPNEGALLLMRPATGSVLRAMIYRDEGGSTQQIGTDGTLAGAWTGNAARVACRLRRNLDGTFSYFVYEGWDINVTPIISSVGVTTNIPSWAGTLPGAFFDRAVNDAAQYLQVNQMTCYKLV